jgi:hypothetical protein
MAPKAEVMRLLCLMEPEAEAAMELEVARAMGEVARVERAAAAAMVVVAALAAVEKAPCHTWPGT